MKKLCVLAFLCLGCGRSDPWPQQIIAKAEPVQKTLPGKMKGWSHKGYLLTPQAEYSLIARVLLLEKFSSGREAELSPEDLSLGWGEMSNSGYLSQISMQHVERYYQWEIKGEVPDKDTIIQHSANTHFIPANDQVAAILKAVRVHDLIQAHGYLVNVAAPDGWTWSSSLVRSDTGTGACELFWCDKLETLVTPH
ncbi:MAG: hypothetical protein KF760_31095 [Candidatus Eremiobacteraeota bacterium]|nr:hypothetical protein [Candidatus Eremiobacteraeota bacterium]MCW5869733.1 hypothetical protein [Candidatus Eremiobacteraeota bacterium]